MNIKRGKLKRFVLVCVRLMQSDKFGRERDRKKSLIDDTIRSFV